MTDSHRAGGPVLITGGAGFIGANLADRLLQTGHRVVLYDNLSRAGVERNVRWLVDRHGHNVRFVLGDVRDRIALRAAVDGIDRVYHLAAQVAVTSSLEDPVEDFEINAGGTLRLLEEVRRLPCRPSVVFTSTNKVYGALPHVVLLADERRYRAVDVFGVDEATPLDLHSPYGCSKGAADQYVLDYARSFDLPTVVLRMSCIYGPRQYGNEDQGWVAHFVKRAMAGKSITIYGDGKQVRDVLYVDDLVNALERVGERAEMLAGTAFNIGGGPTRCSSLLELVDLIEAIHGQRPDLEFADWRKGDQRYYCSDIEKFSRATGWRPMVEIEDGVRRLYDWLRSLPPVRLSETPERLMPGPVE